MKRMKFKDGKGLWFTADSHFGHDKIIRPDYADRPFTSSAEMDGALIQNWNTFIGKDDTVFHLGDFAWGSKKRTEALLSQLPGHKHLIVGGHDHSDTRKAKGWASVEYYREVIVGEQAIMLSHYPMLTWNLSVHGSWMLHGHCHDGLKDWKCPNCEASLHKLARRCDVGVDGWDFCPVNMAQLAEYMVTTKFVPVDHHREREA